MFSKDGEQSRVEDVPIKVEKVKKKEEPKTGKSSLESSDFEIVRIHP